MIASWKKYIIGCAVGNFLEWYDFILYGFFAPVFAHLFFPTKSHYISLLLTFAVFASGCLVRPFSGVLFGHIGDKLGRKKALIYSIILITISTTLMGVLPTYQTAGILAPTLLVFCRLIQGVAVSAEEVGAAILLIENAPKQQKTFMGSIVLSSVYIGLFFGALTALVVFTLCTDNFLYAWGWRIPFLLASVLGIFALKIRVKAFDSREYLQAKQENATFELPVKIMFKRYFIPFIKAIGASTVLAVAIYIFAVYLPSYYIELANFNVINSLEISVVFLFAIALLVLLIGLWGDKIGAKKLMLVGCVGLLFTSYPIFWLLAQQVLWMAILAEFVLVFFLSFVAGCVLSIVIMLFPVNVRYSGACISFNISMTLFGSTAPMIILTLHTFFKSPVAPCLYLAGAALLSIVALTWGDIKLFLFKSSVSTVAESKGI